MKELEKVVEILQKIINQMVLDKQDFDTIYNLAKAQSIIEKELNAENSGGQYDEKPF